MVDHMKQEAAMRELATCIDTALEALYKQKMGFTLLVFEFHKPGISNYISNAERESMLEGLRETIKRFEDGEVMPAAKGTA